MNLGTLFEHGAVAAEVAAQPVLIDPLLNYIPLIPLLGSVVVYLLCSSRRGLHFLSGWLATAFAAASFSIALVLFDRVREGAVVNSTLWEWFRVGTFRIGLDFQLDRLSGVMTLVVTGIGSLIHLYAIGYMAEDEHRPRFFAYLNLFLFSMLLLVLGKNMLVMFAGWEGVGLCSYLLIGFWFKEMGNAKAGQKAFVVNRIGDAGFLLGMFLLCKAFGTLDFSALQVGVAGWSKSVMFVGYPFYELVAFLLFIGAMGKSAQIPLYIWLPDAMAGPTPVSALIHAATMVTAGVYMMARMSFVYILAPHTLLLICTIGAVTAFVAATIALVQNDIKKVLAYSTVSQLGYMFMAMGSAAFSNGIYHVVTHAFFKACLFMCAGSVIMGCHHEQDMRHFGGLWRKMPVTALCYLCSTLAIAGIYYTSGFFSKDAILWAVYSSPVAEILWFGVPASQVLWSVGAVTAFLTAFYMTRSFVMTFLGSYRGHAHPHESPLVVTVPLMLLAIPSLVFGAMYGETLLEFLSAWTRADLQGGHHALAEIPMYEVLEHRSVIIAIVGVLLALFVFTKGRSLATGTARIFKPLYQFLQDKWRVDEFYDATVLRLVRILAAVSFLAVDRVLIDGLVNGSAQCVDAVGDGATQIQRGRVSEYALWMFAGALFMTFFYLVVA